MPLGILLELQNLRVKPAGVARLQEIAYARVITPKLPRSKAVDLVAVRRAAR